MKALPKKYVKVFLNLGLAVIIFLFCVFVLPKFIRLFMPFLVGWIIACIANPIVRFFEEKLKVRRKAGSAIVIVGVIAGILAIAYGLAVKLFQGLRGFLMNIPELSESFQRDISSIGENLSMVTDKLPPQVFEQIESVNQSINNVIQGMIGKISGPTVDAVGNFAKNLPGILFAVLMCLLSAYFFVSDKDKITEKVRNYLPVSVQKKLLLLKESIFDAIGGYFKAQLKIEVWIYLFMLVGFWILKIDYAYLIALGIAALDFLPVFGTGAVLMPWAVLKFLSANYTMAVGLLVIWGVGQLARQLIQPKIVGDSIGVPLLPTLILLYVGYKLAGMVGMIVSVPLATVIQNMYAAGLFDTTKNSLRILWYGFNEFRKLTPEDLAEVDKVELEEKQEWETAMAEMKTKEQTEEETDGREL